MEQGTIRVMQLYFTLQIVCSEHATFAIDSNRGKYAVCPQCGAVYTVVIDGSVLQVGSSLDGVDTSDPVLPAQPFEFPFR